MTQESSYPAPRENRIDRSPYCRPLSAQDARLIVGAGQDDGPPSQ